MTSNKCVNQNCNHNEGEGAGDHSELTKLVIATPYNQIYILSRAAEIND